MPSPGASRPRYLRKTGATKPSTSRNSHSSAATEMNSGTVTKKPATKLRRSHCMDGAPASGPPVDSDGERHAEGDPVPGERPEAAAADVVQERSDHDRR